MFLFEANDERRNGWAVQSHLPRSISLNVAAWVSSAALLAAALFLFFGEYTRLVRAEGVMLPVGGLARLTAPSSGWIKLKRVQEGDAVQAGDVLYTLCVDYITENGWVNKAGLNLLRMQRQEVSDAIERQQTLSRIEKQQLSDELEDARQEQAHLGSYRALLRKFTVALEKNAIRQEDLIAKGLATLGQVETRQQAHMSYQLQLEAAERDRLQLRARINQLEHRLQMHDRTAEARISELRQRLVEIDRQMFEGEGRSEIQIVAPRAGVVTAVMADEGQMVQAGFPLLTIVPKDAHLQGNLLVPSTGIGFIRAGDEVLMRYEAFPYQKFGQFGGRIVSISGAALNQDELSTLISQRFSGPAGTFYLVTIEPNETVAETTAQLPPGMRFEAHVRTETRKLYEWLLNPLSRVTGRIADL